MYNVCSFVADVMAQEMPRGALLAEAFMSVMN